MADPQKVSEDLKKMLAKNPLVSAEEIFAHYADKLLQLLDDDFESYCTDDDYYQPVVEDYVDNFDYVVQDFCKKHGLEMVSSKFNGFSSDFEPDDYHSRYW